MCAFCPQDAKRESLGGRCRGHGVDSKLTRWRSTIHSKCHGKWRRVQETRKCPCKKGPDFIFVWWEDSRCISKEIAVKTIFWEIPLFYKCIFIFLFSLIMYVNVYVTYNLFNDKIKWNKYFASIVISCELKIW